MRVALAVLLLLVTVPTAAAFPPDPEPRRMSPAQWEVYVTQRNRTFASFGRFRATWRQCERQSRTAEAPLRHLGRCLSVSYTPLYYEPSRRFYGVLLRLEAGLPGHLGECEYRLALLRNDLARQVVTAGEVVEAARRNDARSAERHSRLLRTYDRRVRNGRPWTEQGCRPA